MACLTHGKYVPSTPIKQMEIVNHRNDDRGVHVARPPSYRISFQVNSNCSSSGWATDAFDGESFVEVRSVLFIGLESEMSVFSRRRRRRGPKNDCSVRFFLFLRCQPAVTRAEGSSTNSSVRLFEFDRRSEMLGQQWMGAHNHH